jgi:ABC-type sugar transport system ATPase subunit
MEVRLEGISKRFGTVQVLKDVDLQFPSRKFVTLLGPSGCGKTTLLRMIAGLEEITAGKIVFGDRVVNGLAPKDRNIAMVFQSYALYPQMTVRKNLGYGLKVRGVAGPEIDSAVERVAKILEIDKLLDRKPGQLSGGQRQRVALGRAMVRKPDIFLMDEPLSNLDAKLRVTMRGELRRFHLDLNATTVYVTHDQLEAMTMSDLVAVMHQGAVQQFGTPAEVYSRPANLFVAGFIGSPPMNFIAGTIVNGRFEAPDAALSLPALTGEHEGQKVVLGIRPQDLAFASSEEENCLEGRISLVELLGSEKLIEIELATGSRVHVLVRAESDYVAGASARVRFEPSRMHVFDEAHGGSIRKN